MSNNKKQKNSDLYNNRYYGLHALERMNIDSDEKTKTSKLLKDAFDNIGKEASVRKKTKVSDVSISSNPFKVLSDFVYTTDFDEIIDEVYQEIYDEAQSNKTISAEAEKALIITKLKSNNRLSQIYKTRFKKYEADKSWKGVGDLFYDYSAAVYSKKSSLKLDRETKILKYESLVNDLSKVNISKLNIKLLQMFLEENPELKNSVYRKDGLTTKDLAEDESFNDGRILADFEQFRIKKMKTIKEDAKGKTDDISDFKDRQLANLYKISKFQEDSGKILKPVDTIAMKSAINIVFAKNDKEDVLSSLENHYVIKNYLGGSDFLTKSYSEQRKAIKTTFEKEYINKYFTSTEIFYEEVKEELQENLKYMLSSDEITKEERKELNAFLTNDNIMLLILDNDLINLELRKSPPFDNYEDDKTLKIYNKLNNVIHNYIKKNNMSFQGKLLSSLKTDNDFLGKLFVDEIGSAIGSIPYQKNLSSKNVNDSNASFQGVDFDKDKVKRMQYDYANDTVGETTRSSVELKKIIGIIYKEISSWGKGRKKWLNMPVDELLNEIVNCEDNSEFYNLKKNLEFNGYMVMVKNWEADLKKSKHEAHDLVRTKKEKDEFYSNEMNRDAFSTKFDALTTQSKNSKGEKIEAHDKSFVTDFLFELARHYGKDIGGAINFPFMKPSSANKGEPKVPTTSKNLLDKILSGLNTVDNKEEGIKKDDKLMYYIDILNNKHAGKYGKTYKERIGDNEYEDLMTTLFSVLENPTQLKKVISSVNGVPNINGLTMGRLESEFLPEYGQDKQFELEGERGTTYFDRVNNKRTDRITAEKDYLSSRGLEDTPRYKKLQFYLDEENTDTNILIAGSSRISVTNKEVFNEINGIKQEHDMLNAEYVLYEYLNTANSFGQEVTVEEYENRVDYLSKQNNHFGAAFCPVDFYTSLIKENQDNKKTFNTVYNTDLVTINSNGDIEELFMPEDKYYMLYEYKRLSIEYGFNLDYETFKASKYNDKNYTKEDFNIIEKETTISIESTKNNVSINNYNKSLKNVNTLGNDFEANVTDLEKVFYKEYLKIMSNPELKESEQIDKISELILETKKQIEPNTSNMKNFIKFSLEITEDKKIYKPIYNAFYMSVDKDNANSPLSLEFDETVFTLGRTIKTRSDKHTYRTINGDIMFISEELGINTKLSELTDKNISDIILNLPYKNREEIELEKPINMSKRLKRAEYQDDFFNSQENTNEKYMINKMAYSDMSTVYKNKKKISFIGNKFKLSSSGNIEIKEMNDQEMNDLKEYIAVMRKKININDKDFLEKNEHLGKFYLLLDELKENDFKIPTDDDGKTERFLRRGLEGGWIPHYNETPEVDDMDSSTKVDNYSDYAGYYLEKIGLVKSEKQLGEKGNKFYISTKFFNEKENKMEDFKYVLTDADLKTVVEGFDPTELVKKIFLNKVYTSFLKKSGRIEDIKNTYNRDVEDSYGLFKFKRLNGAESYKEALNLINKNRSNMNMETVEKLNKIMDSKDMDYINAEMNKILTKAENKEDATDLKMSNKLVNINEKMSEFFDKYKNSSILNDTLNRFIMGSSSSSSNPGNEEQKSLIARELLSSSALKNKDKSFGEFDFVIYISSHLDSIIETEEYKNKSSIQDKMEYLRELYNEMVKYSTDKDIEELDTKMEVFKDILQEETISKHGHSSSADIEIFNNNATSAAPINTATDKETANTINIKTHMKSIMEEFPNETVTKKLEEIGTSDTEEAVMEYKKVAISYLKKVVKKAVNVDEDIAKKMKEVLSLDKDKNSNKEYDVSIPAKK